MKKLILMTLMPLGGALLSAGIAHAEGKKTFTGAFGINRVVRSTSSSAAGGAPRTATAGTVTLSLIQPLSRAGGFDIETNPFNNKATAYLGGEARDTANATQQYDAGLQFETGVFGNYTKGWGAFFSRGNSYVTGHIYDGTNDVAWRPPAASPGWQKNNDATTGKYVNATGSITSDLAFTVVPSGPCTVLVSALNKGSNTFVYNPVGNNSTLDVSTTATAAHPVAPWYDPTSINTRYNNANQSLATLKRVSGMTRSPSWHDELDGSGMSAAWSACTINGGSWVGMVDQNTTGYDSAANSLSAWDRRAYGLPTLASRTTTEFSGGGLSNNANARSSVDNANRYNGETVTANSGTATILEGQEVEWE